MLSALGGLSNGFKLKKTRQSILWIDISFNLLNNKSPTIRMREIDGYRIHIPIEEEREKFKIPQSNDRLILSDHMNVMMLCGGFAGVHFSPEEMNQIIFLSAEFDNRFKILENYFNTLTTSQKNYVKKETNVNSSSSLSTSSLPSPPPSSSSSTTTTSNSLDSLTPPIPPLESTENKETIEVNSKNEDDEMVDRFHQLADSVIDILRQLQPVVKSIQSHLPANDEVIIKKDDDEVDCSSKPNSLPRPKWLEILLQKYINRPQNSNNSNSSSTSSSTTSVKNSFVLPPIGTFASFLSCCVTEQIDCVKIEYDALVELILASNDCNGNILTDNSDLIRNEIFSHTQRYWANRFYQFLRKLPELKSAIKDEQTIYDFKRFL